MFPNWAGVNNMLVGLYAIAGDLENAERAKDRALSIMFNWRDSPRSNTWRFHTAGVQAKILQARGQYEEAEPLMRRAVQLAMTPTIKSGYPQALISSHSWLARNLMAQSSLVEAEVEARQALLDSIKFFGSRSLETRWSIQVLATILSKQGRHHEAERLFNKFISIMEAGGISADSPAMGFTRYGLGNVLIELGDWSGALKEFRLARVILEREPAFFKKYGIDHHRTIEILGLLAVALFDTGETSQPFDLFFRAVPNLLENRAVGAQQKKLILERYIELLARVRDTSIERKAGVNAVAEAFRIAGALQAQSVQYAQNARNG
jgi:tetratricopeptide (TPR) repeat protein